MVKCMKSYANTFLSKQKPRKPWFLLAFPDKKRNHLSMIPQRRQPDLNWWSGCCRPTPYHLAMSPYLIAYQISLINDPNEIRTRVTAVKGRCLNRLTMGPLIYSIYTYKKYVSSPSRTWTYDSAVNSRVLYRLSYRGIRCSLTGNIGIIWYGCFFVKQFVSKF